MLRLCEIFFKFIIILLAGCGCRWLWHLHADHLFASTADVSKASSMMIAVAPVLQGIWANKIHAIGTVKAVQGTVISAAMSGDITGIYFLSGQQVARGDLLVTLNNADRKAVVMQDEAKYSAAKKHCDRFMKLFHQQIIAQADLDNDLANCKVLFAQLMQDQAALEKSYIRAPFSGTIDLRQMNIGQYVTEGEKIISLQDTSQLEVDFPVSAIDIDKIQIGDPVVFRNIYHPLQKYTGVITALGSQLDITTRTLLVRAAVKANFSPGMFVSVDVVKPQTQTAVIVPENAVVYDPDGEYVYVVLHGLAQQRKISVQDSDGSHAVLQGNIRPGESVVVAGQMKLFDGAKVSIE